jgi:hypothetical protein
MKLKQRCNREDIMTKPSFEKCKKCKVAHIEFESVGWVTFRPMDDKGFPIKDTSEIIGVRAKEILIMACPKCGKIDTHSIRIGWL